MTAARLIDAIQVKLFSTLVMGWMAGIFGGQLEREKLLPMAIALEEVAHRLRRMEMEQGGESAYVKLDPGLTP
jgi:hypothetical protein